MSNDSLTQKVPGKRHSRQREVVFSVLEDSAGPLLVAEILSEARARLPGIGQATVYRVLKSLQEADMAQPVSIHGSEVRYELKRRCQNHHFLCRSCRKVRCVDASAEWVNSTIKLPTGFVVEEHELTLIGLCPECSGNS